MDSLIIIIFGLMVIQVVSLYIIQKGNGRSVNEAAKRASESTRKNFENKLYKISPWLKGFDPNKIVQKPFEEEEPEVEEDG